MATWWSNNSGSRNGLLATSVLYMMLLVDKKVQKISKPTVAIKAQIEDKPIQHSCYFNCFTSAIDP